MNAGIKMSIVACILFGAVWGRAEVVTRAIVTVMAGSMDLYAIDENGVWTKERTLVPSGDSVMKRNTRCVYRNGVVYALDMIKDPNKDGTGGYVRKYDLQGRYLGDLGHFPGQAEGICFSSDGQYLFLGYAFQLLSGQIDRMSLADGSVTTFKTGLGQIRQIATDGRGQLYAPTRNSGPITIIDEQMGNTVKSVSQAAQGIAYDPVADRVCFCQSGSSYGTMKRDGSDVTTRSDGPMGGCFAMAIIAGRPHYAAYGGGIYRQEADGTFTTVVSTTGNYSGLTEVPLDPVAVWHFDEAAGAASFANAYDAKRYPIYAEGFLKSGATGVSSRGLYFGRRQARAEIRHSEKLIPATNDFTVAFWAGLPATAAGETPLEQYFLSNNCGDGRLNVMANLDGSTNTLCLFYAPPTGSYRRIFSSVPFADGRWHHVAVRRKAGAFSLWLDGACVGTAEATTAEPISQLYQWNIGCAYQQISGFVRPGAFFDELSVYRAALNESAIRTLARAFTPGDPPTEPADVPAADPLPAALGQEVAHLYGCDAAVVDPALLVASDGTWYLASGRGNRPYAEDQETCLRKSTDRGVTWSVAARLALGNVSLFETTDGKLAVAGMTVGYGAFGKYVVRTSADGGVSWSEGASVNVGANRRFSSAPPLLANGRLWQSYVELDAYGASPGYVSFSANGSTFGDGALQGCGYPEHATLMTHPENNALQRMLPGQMLTNATPGMVYALNPIEDRHPSGACLIGGERIVPVRVAGKNSCVFLPFLAFPGGAKRFAMCYDAASALYWAVSVPVTNTAELAGHDAPDLRGTLALYASPDLFQWRRCGTVLASETATFDAPVLAVAGNDLVLAYAVATADGVGGARSVADGNYLAVKVVPDFRTAYAPEAPGRWRVLQGDFSRNAVVSFYQASDGAWYSGGIFAQEVDKVVGVQAGHGRVYVSQETTAAPGAIKVFNNAGKLLRTLTPPEGVKTDNICLARDGSYLLVADPFGGNALWRCDLADASWRKLAQYDGSATGLPSQVRALALDSRDGSFYVMGRNTNTSIRRFAKDGTHLETLIANLGSAQHLALALDEARNRLYYADALGNVSVIDLAVTPRTSTRVESAVYSAGLNHSAAFDFVMIAGTPYVGGPLGPLHAVRADGGAATCAPFPKGFFSTRLAVQNVDSRAGGFLLLVR